MNKIINGEELKLKQIIMEAFKELKFENISNCLNRSLMNLKTF